MEKINLFLTENTVLLNFSVLYIVRYAILEMSCKRLWVIFGQLGFILSFFKNGQSKFGMTGNVSLKNWEVTSQLKNIRVPTLVIGAQYGTINPKNMKWMSMEVQNNHFLLCSNGRHLTEYNDQKKLFHRFDKIYKRGE